MKTKLNTIGAMIITIAVNLTSVNGQTTTNLNPVAEAAHELILSVSLDEEARTIQAIAEETAKDFDTSAYASNLLQRLQKRLAEIPTQTSNGTNQAQVAVLNTAIAKPQKSAPDTQPAAVKPKIEIELDKTSAGPGATPNHSLQERMANLEVAVRRLTQKVDLLTKLAAHYVTK
jgi:hypothetical protein